MSANDHNDRDNDPVWNLLDQAPATPVRGEIRID